MLHSGPREDRGGGGESQHDIIRTCRKEVLFASVANTDTKPLWGTPLFLCQWHMPAVLLPIKDRLTDELTFPAEIGSRRPALSFPHFFCSKIHKFALPCLRVRVEPWPMNPLAQSNPPWMEESTVLSTAGTCKKPVTLTYLQSTEPGSE